MPRLFSLSLVLSLVLLFAGCSSAPSQFVKRSDYGSLDSVVMDREMPFSVYTPPGWDGSTSLPLVVLLHGAGGSHKNFDQYEIGAYLDKKILSGEIPPAIIVNPEGEMGFWENWADGSRAYRDWVVKELLPYVARTYNTLPCPESCHITGVSMGGHGAMRLAYYEDNVFSSVAAISSAIINEREFKASNSLRTKIMRKLIPIEKIWGNVSESKAHLPKDLDPYINWVEKPEMQDIRLLLAWADNDYTDIRGANERFHQHLSENQREHAKRVFVGRHKWVDWKSEIANALKFHINYEDDVYLSAN